MPAHFKAAPVSVRSLPPLVNQHLYGLARSEPPLGPYDNEIDTFSANVKVYGMILATTFQAHVVRLKDEHADAAQAADELARTRVRGDGCAIS
jgi:hypothetical protein